MKKMIFTLAAFTLMFAGVAQNEKPTGNETNPDSLNQKANYNTTRSNKTVKDPKGKGAKEEKKEEKVKVGNGGGSQSVKTPFVLLHDQRKITRDLK